VLCTCNAKDHDTVHRVHFLDCFRHRSTCRMLTAKDHDTVHRVHFLDCFRHRSTCRMLTEKGPNCKKFTSSAGSSISLVWWCRRRRNGDSCGVVWSGQDAITSLPHCCCVKSIDHFEIFPFGIPFPSVLTHCHSPTHMLSLSWKWVHPATHTENI
jgi:hypothetical protein